MAHNVTIESPNEQKKGRVIHIEVLKLHIKEKEKP